MQELQTVLSAYPKEFQPDRVEHLGAAGGFSGARFWRLQTPSGPLCLRRWPPEHPSVDRLEYIHGVLSHVSRAGVGTVPAPLKNRLGNSYSSSNGCLWELAPWMPGKADYWRLPNRNRLDAAMRALAEFHRAASSFAQGRARDAVAPSLSQRRDLLVDLLGHGYRKITNAIASGQRDEDPQMASAANRILTLFPQVATEVSLQLNAACKFPVPVQPVIRDVWHDHVLFTGDAVTGLIDFGALRADSVAVDISRLLGSLIGDDAEAWEHGLKAYQQVRLLSGQEYELIGTLDSSTILLSGFNWLRWIYLEERVFDNQSLVAGRLREIAERLGNLTARGGRPIVQYTKGIGF